MVRDLICLASLVPGVVPMILGEAHGDTSLKLEDRVRHRLQEARKRKVPAVPTALQGVTKDRIKLVLSRIDLSKADLVDVVFALLDNETPSWYTQISTTAKFSDGASTAQIACHVGILQRGGTKLDREGRDYWIKPLRDVGAIELVTLDSVSRTFLAGHPVAKSSNSAYKLSADFIAVLRAPEKSLASQLERWVSEAEVRKRLEHQAHVAAQAQGKVDRTHADLIESASTEYARVFLSEFEVLMRDDSDGQRVSEETRKRLGLARLDLHLDDPMPDLLLWRKRDDAFWIIEAVTSDGEVDLQKVQLVRRFINRTHPASAIGFTTAYRTWQDAARRQARMKNLAPGSYLWILEDPSKHFLVEAFEIACRSK